MISKKQDPRYIKKKLFSKKQDPRYIEIVILAISKNTSLNDKTGEDPRYLENCYSRSGYLARKPRQKNRQRGTSVLQKTGPR